MLRQDSPFGPWNSKTSGMREWPLKPNIDGDGGTGRTRAPSNADEVTVEIFRDQPMSKTSEPSAHTLFASGDSVTSGELVPCSKLALRLDPSMKEMTP